MVLFICIFLSYCGNEKGKSINGPQIKKKGDVSYVSNPNNPEKGTFEYELVELLTIGDEKTSDTILAKPRQVKIGRDGKIYIFEYAAQQIKIFDEKGVYLSSLGNRGEGPGEFKRISHFELDHENKLIHIIDGKVSKIVRYRLNGQYESEIKLTIKFPNYFYLTPDGFYNIINSYWKDDGGKYYKVVKYDPQSGESISSLEFLATIHKLNVTGNISIDLSTPFDPLCMVDVNQEKNLIQGFSDKYELKVFNPQFKLTTVIKKAISERVKIPDDSIKKFKDSLRKAEIRKGVDLRINDRKIPEYHPLFLNIVADNNNRWWIRTPSGDNNAHVDLFDNEGVYIEKMIIHEVPGGISFEELFRRCVIRDNFIYALVKTIDGIPVLKKYKLKRIK